jgi:hypothetical protein
MSAMIQPLGKYTMKSIYLDAETAKLLQNLQKTSKITNFSDFVSTCIKQMSEDEENA